MIGSAWAAGAGDAAKGAFYTDPTFWVAVSFFLFFAIAGRQLWAGITQMLDQRAAQIAKQLDEAQKLRDDAQEVLAQYQRKQREASKEAEGILALARAEAERMKAKAQTDLDTAIRLREKQAMDRIAQAEAKALADVRNQAVDVALSATRQLLAEQTDPARAAALIDQAIAELPKRLH